LAIKKVNDEMSRTSTINMEPEVPDPPKKVTTADTPDTPQESPKQPTQTTGTGSDGTGNGKTDPKVTEEVVPASKQLLDSGTVLRILGSYAYL